MKKEFIDLVVDIAPAIAIVSIFSTFLKGTKSMIQYIRALIASFVLGIPAACFVEYYFNNWLLKYAIVLAVGTFSICIFNGLSRVADEFAKSPMKTIKKIKEENNDQSR